nr:DUF6503 family protein [uncultured Psychroserpens sp.]
MKGEILLILAFSLFGCHQKQTLDGEFILKEAISKHDSLNVWNTTKLHIHIQEPRLSNPYRYSILELDNSSDSFKLSRNRDQYISEHIVESTENSYVLLDGKIETDSVLIKKYRLDPSRNIKYKDFYNQFYGLPMSLNNSVEKIFNTSESIFNNEECYKIETKLNKSVISRYWIIYVSKYNKTIKGLEIVFPDKPNKGERIYFEGFVIINGIKIPRIRHWHELKDNMYSGTDVIVKELTD